MSLTKALIAVAGCGIILLLERLVPFLLFSKKNPPAFVKFIEKFVPPMAMMALVLYCLKDVSYASDFKSIIPPVLGVLITVILHLIKRNSLLSIFSGTAVYMILLKIL